MHVWKSGSSGRCLKRIAGVMLLLAAAGCTYKPSYIQAERTNVPNRWKVEKVELARLSEDQQQTLDRRGPPTYVRFFREVETRQPVYAWIYANEGEAVDLVWFVDGTRVDTIAVDKDPSAFSSTTRRRTRLTLLVGTGAAIIPAVVLLANQ